MGAATGVPTMPVAPPFLFYRLLLSFRTLPRIEHVGITDPVRGETFGMLLSVTNIGGEQFPGGKLTEVKIEYKSGGATTFDHLTPEAVVPSLQPSQTAQLPSVDLVAFRDGPVEIHVKLTSADGKPSHLFQNQFADMGPDWFNFAFVVSAEDTKQGYRAIYAPISSEALSYVALTITTVGIQIAVVVGAISNAKLLTVPWPLFLVVVGSAMLSVVFAMASMARFEILGHIASRAGLHNLASTIVKESDNEPFAHKFMREWFESELAFFGFRPEREPTSRGLRFLKWVSSGRVALPLISLVFFDLTMLYVLWPHVTW